MFAPYGIPDYRTFGADMVNRQLLRAAKQALQTLQAHENSAPKTHLGYSAFRAPIDKLQSAILVAERRPSFWKRLFGNEQ